jgi:hypothetical protein
MSRVLVAAAVAPGGDARLGGRLKGQVLGLEKDKDSNKQMETQEFNPKFAPTKEATSPLRIPQRRAITKSLFSSSNPHKGRLVLTKNSPSRKE